MKKTFLLFALVFTCARLVSAPRTVVGVVNWDCSLPSDTYFGHYSTTSLSPAKYRHCTPFYADVKGSDAIDFHWRTVAEYEREMQYAIDAGIDYFAYCWYGEMKDGKDFSPVTKGATTCCDRYVWELATARQLHAKSSLRDKIKMCAILVVLHPIADQEFETLARAMTEPWYQTACERPLVYLFGFGGKGGNVLPRLRAACRKVGAKDPYAAVLGCNRFQTTGDDGVQALSSYTDGAPAKDFASLNRRNIGCNGHRAGTGMPVIPNFTVGWDPSPRNDHNVPWCGYARNVAYAPPATENELMAGAERMATWIKANRKSCPTGHILSFAWNEFEEGGWICPIWRAGGKPDTSRLEAFRKVGDYWRRELDQKE